MPFPKYHIQGNSDCFRCSLAYCLDMHPSRVKFIPPFVGKDDKNMYELYDEYLYERFGFRLLWFSKQDAIDMFLSVEKNWIAIVPPLKTQPAYHAIVMNGSKLVYDPNGSLGRRQKPKKIQSAIVVADDVQHSEEDETLSFIY